MWRRVAAVQPKGWTSTSQMGLLLQVRWKTTSLSDLVSQIWACIMKSFRGSNFPHTTENQSLTRGSTPVSTLVKTPFQTKWTTLSIRLEPMSVLSRLCTTMMWLSKKTQLLAASALRRQHPALSLKLGLKCKNVTWRTSTTKRACTSTSTRCNGPSMRAPAAFSKALTTKSWLTSWRVVTPAPAWRYSRTV